MTDELNTVQPPNEDNNGSGSEDGSKSLDWFTAIRNGTDDDVKKTVRGEVERLISRYPLTHYQVLMLFDIEDAISNWHSDQIYSAAEDRQSTNDILLIIDSAGGAIEPAFLISKSLKKISRSKFAVAVPRRAKSAATLICLGADEIHMGMTSQLGPIDPQIGGLPALGLANALDTLADLACRFPGASNMLSKYLTDNLSLNILGYYNRVSESAVQYAERLLQGKRLADSWNTAKVANHLVNHYKDHGFVIDVDEARLLLGSQIIKENTNEYKMANEIYSFLDLIRFMIDTFRQKRFDWVGSIESGITLREPKGA